MTTEPETPPWTPEDVDLVASALAEQQQDDVFSNPEFSGAHWDGYRDIYRSDAGAVLAALASAGRLVSPGAEMTERQYGIELPSGRGIAYTTEAVARHKAEEFHRPLIRRWVGPWEPVPGDRDA